MSKHPDIWQDWGKLQTSDHYYYMCTKWFSDGAVHKYFNPYASPYEAFINYMNVLSDFMIRLDESLVIKQEGSADESEVKEKSEPVKQVPGKKSAPKVRTGKLKLEKAVAEIKQPDTIRKKKPEIKAVKKEKIKEQPFKSLDINEILNVSDRKVKEIIKSLPIETVSFAMKGADKEVKEKVEKNLGKKALNAYHELLKQLKSITTADVKKYRKEIIKQIKS